MNTQTLTLSHLFIFLLTTLPLSLSYSPQTSIAIDCGSSSYLPLDLVNRPWVGESQNSEFLIIEKNNKSLTFSAEKQPTDRVPCFTARVSLSSFSYLFSLSSKDPIFIRLHFYPDRYGTFDPSKALFDVLANGFTLVSNFSPILNTRYLNEESLVKEYCLYPQDENLNLTFIPSISSPDSFAFINGIEIVSFPNDLYYGSDGLGVSFIGNEQNPYQLLNTTALELAYRLNVGGGFISTVDDTGMFREWKTDNGFTNFVGALPEGLDIKLKYSINFPNYTAPENVYKTARTMGNNGTKNEGHNLTWNLPVDSGFAYWVRLHFCEFQDDVQKRGDREFIIYIYNWTAEEQADVIVWSGGHGVPVYRDYVVIVSGENKKTNLSIGLHPRSEQYKVYSDAILNGMEVFKLSNDGSLAVPKLSIQDTQNGHTSLIAGVSAGIAVSILAICLILGFLFFRRGKSTKDTVSYVSVKSGSSSLCRHFSIAEVRAATKNFDKVFIIGHGGFGFVYKGVIDGGVKTVALKRLYSKSAQGAGEFWTEIEILSKLRHTHLVSLLGYCDEDGEMILVYEYMENGSLADHLHKISSNGGNNLDLSWEQKLKICIGAARGLDYLHTGTPHGVIHRDVKTTNILLDNRLVAKISDFGLCKVGPTSHSYTHVSTIVKGTFGYLDPEYFLTHRLTKKSDVFAFGVVLLEVLCGRPAVDTSLTEDRHSLALWAKHCIREGKNDEIIGPGLWGQISSNCLEIFVEVAYKCLDDRANGRPTMSDVVVSLEGALASQNHSQGNSSEHVEEEDANDDESDSDCTQLSGSSTDQMNGAL